MDSDAILLQRYADSRDASAFAELARRYRTMVYSVGRRVTGNAHDAEDVAQGCFVQLAVNAGSISASVPGWLHTAALRIASNVNREAARRKRREQERAEALTPETSPQADASDWGAVGPQVDAALEALPEDLRLPLILHFLQDLTQAEVAERLNVSRATVARRLEQGVERLRHRLSRIGVGGVATAVALTTLLKANAVQAAPPQVVAGLGRIAMAGVGSSSSATPVTAQSTAGGVSLSAAIRAMLLGLSAKTMVAIVLALVALIAVAAQVPAIVGGEKPYDIVYNAYASYTPTADPLGFPMKVQALTTSPYKFWRGTKDLYYHWAKTNTTDWLADKSSYIVTHADLHPGNIGTYVVGPNKLAFGLVDFDDSTKLPFQLELLHGLISLEIAGAGGNTTLPADQRAALLDAMLAAYREGLTSRKTATQLLAGDKVVVDMLARESKNYKKELRDYVGNDGHFRNVVLDDKKDLKEILRPADDLIPSLAAGLAEAIARSESLQKEFNYKDVATIKSSIISVSQRLRMGSSGSQGLRKYFVLMHKPLKSIHGDAIIYLKQQAPTAAERQEIIPLDSRDPGERYVADLAALTAEKPWITGWCKVQDESYWVSLKEPWSNELSVGPDKGAMPPMEAARYWGIVTGAAHRLSGSEQNIIQKLTPTLRDQLLARSEQYTAYSAEQYAAFCADSRVISATTALKDALTKAQQEFAVIDSGRIK